MLLLAPLSGLLVVFNSYDVICSYFDICKQSVTFNQTQIRHDSLFFFPKRGCSFEPSLMFIALSRTATAM